MTAISVTPGHNIDENDFWVNSGVSSINERFQVQTSQTGNIVLGIGTVAATYNEYVFESGGFTYRYIGDWELSVNGSLLTTALSAHGVYDQVIIEQGGVQVASLTMDSPLSVNFGATTSLAPLGLNLLTPVLDLLIASDSDQAVANIHLLATPNLPDLAGIEPGIIQPGPGNVVDGTTGADDLTGTAGEDQISGLDGNDTVHGGAGDDVISGNEGNDSLHGEDGDDIVYGGQGDDLVDGGAGNDYLVGGLGTDSVYGRAGNDLIYGGNGTSDPADGGDQLFGGQGMDTIYGNGGADVIHGGDGAGDLTDGGDLIYGGQGDDLIYGNAGDDQIFGNLQNDTLFGDQGNDFIHGGQGEDQLFGGDGNDTLNGGAGADILSGGAGSDLFVFTPGQGNDVITDFNAAGGDRLDLQGQTYNVSNNDGSLALILSGGGSIVLQGVSPDAFDPIFLA